MSDNEFIYMTDLAAERLGGKALLCSDDFFAEKENLLKPGRGLFIPGKYTDRGKWMDGWESRRKREPGHDWCIIQLAAPGVIHGVDIDTNHFIGNHPPLASIEAFNIQEAGTEDLESLPWVEILPASPLQPGSQNLFDVRDENIYTHLRLNIYPDGGVARLKVYGEIRKNWSTLEPGEEVDLAAAANGARAILCNDMFFSPMENLLMPGTGEDMADGWETKRSRNAGNRDWVIVQLATAGTIHRILVDTAHYKGNYPDRCMLEATGKYNSEQTIWTVILHEQKLGADQEHLFEDQLASSQVYTHIRFTIIPDGGVSRLKIFGRPKQQEYSY